MTIVQVVTAWSWSRWRIKPFISHKCNSKYYDVILSKDNTGFTCTDVVATVFNDYFTNIMVSGDSIKDDDKVLVSSSDHETTCSGDNMYWVPCFRVPDVESRKRCERKHE